MALFQARTHKGVDFFVVVVETFMWWQKTSEGQYIIICFSYCCNLKDIREGVFVNFKVILALKINFTLTTVMSGTIPRD